MGRETVLGEATVEEFKRGLRGEVLTPSDEGYDEPRMIWNGMFDKKPALIAHCSGTADVIDAVNFDARTEYSRQYGAAATTRQAALCDGGILIDLSGMNAVHVDPETKRARFQGGATWVTSTAKRRSTGWRRPAASFRRPASAA